MNHRRIRKWTAICRATLLVGWLLSVCSFAAAELTDAQPRIEWDSSSLTLIAQEGGYGRMIRLRDGSILCGYSVRGKIQVRTSGNEGKSWHEPVPVAEINYGTAANPELLQLQDGRVLCCFNERPDDGRHHFAISICFSANAGHTWTEVRRIFEADTRRENGCWEPAALQLPSGELQIYFANESPYRASAEQEISLLRSFDIGSTWKNPTTVSFRAGHRDGMPVPILLQQPPGGIALAIEDNGLGRTFQPAIVYSSGIEWEEGSVLAQSPRRWRAVKTPNPSVMAEGGAPYLRQMPGGETVLSFQSIDAGNKTPHMVVYVGNPWARNFTSRSVPFQVPAGVAGLWNSLFVKSPEVVTAISGTKIGEVKGLWSIDGRLIRPKEDARPKAEIVAVWQHRVNGGPPTYNTFYSNGAINDPMGRATWSLHDRELILRWPGANAPGGAWVDRCVIAPDGRSYLGTNQSGGKLSGQISQSR